MWSFHAASAVIAGDVQRELPAAQVNSREYIQRGSRAWSGSWTGRGAAEHARLYQQATEAARERDEFLAATSRELRTPLSEIKGFVSKLLRSAVMWDEATREDFLREVERDADRLDALISDLLNISCLASGGHIHFQRGAMPPAVLVCGGLDRVRLRIAGSSVDIDSMLGKLPPVYVDAPGSTIHIGGSLIDGGKTVELVVEDDGPVISAEDLDHIFDRFYRGASSCARHDAEVAHDYVPLLVKLVSEEPPETLWAATVTASSTT